jgi:RND family efflux transporter MFP subunit
LEAERVRWGIELIALKDVDVTTLPPVLSARLRLDLAKTKLARFESLVKSQSIAQDDFDQAQSDAAVAQSEWQNQMLLARSSLASIVLREAELDVNRQKLKDTQVFSPMPTGELREDDRFYSIAQRMVSEGTMVRPGDSLFRLVLGRSVKVSLRLQATHNRSVIIGQQVEIEVASEGDLVRGTITRISPVVDPLTRTFNVEIEVPNEELQLKPGNFVKARIFTGQEERVPTIPIVALDTFAGLNKVFSIEHDKAREHLVRIGFQEDDWIEVIEPDLPEGTLIATSAQRMLSDGISVTVKSLEHTEAERPSESATQEATPSEVTR